MVRSPGRRPLLRRPDASVAPAAALLADPARVAILLALLDGRSLAAGELARAAGVGASTASSHLRRLAAAGWIAAEPNGRHRYFRLSNGEVARVLESLAVLGPPAAGRSIAPPAVSNDLRLARSCYDHLAGRAGVAITEALVESGALVLEGRTYRVSLDGTARLVALGVEPGQVAAEAKTNGRYFSRACIDWSERRYHLAGALGHALLMRVLALDWFERRRGTRALGLTGIGRRALQREFGVRLL